MPIRKGSSSRCRLQVGGLKARLRYKTPPAPPAVIPSISSINPNPSPAGAVTVNGANFTDPATVRFAGVAATAVVVVNSGQITCITPAHADGTVAVAVTTAAGTSATFNFVYQAAPITPPPPTGQTGLVTRQGRTLVMDGQPYKFVGTNNFSLTGCQQGGVISVADTELFFSNLRPKSVTRIWAFQPQGTAGLSRAHAAAVKYNQKVIFCLSEGAGGCGEASHPASYYTGGYTTALFPWIDTVVPMFKDSNAIMAWEVQNEAGTSGIDQNVLRNFYDGVAARIKLRDPVHLVSSGSLAPWQGFQSGSAGYAYVHGGPNIDLVSMHEYDYGYQSSRTILSGWWSPTLAAAQQLNKPCFVGEFGIGLASGCMTAAERAAVIPQKFDAYLANGAVGVLYWHVLNPPNNNNGTVCNQIFTPEPPIGNVMTAMRTYTGPNMPVIT